MIEECSKWQEGSCCGNRTNLYFVRLTNGRVYSYNKREGWRYRPEHNFFFNNPSWKPCSPLEVVVVCGIEGLK